MGVWADVNKIKYKSGCCKYYGSAFLCGPLSK